MRKIYFNDMVQQTRDVIEGRVTQWRSICKEQIWSHSDIINAENGIFHFEHPRYDVGEIVAIAQSYKDAGYICHYYNDTDEFMFFLKDSRDVAVPPVAVTNKMFVKAEYMPHKICIKSVRMERLRDISDEDCLKSGVVDVEPRIKGAMRLFYPCEYLKSVAKEVGWGRVFSSPRLAFASLFEKINGDGTWVRDPYVWVYDFELLK